MSANARAAWGRRVLRLLALLGCLVSILAAASGAYLWSLHLQASLEGYRSPLQIRPASEGYPTAPLTSQVVLVIIDGLRADTSGSMPTLATLARDGASAIAWAGVPSYSQPTWTTLVTGAWPEVNGAALLNAPEERIQPLAIDHIFAAARRAGLTTAIVGATWWEHMIPRDELDVAFFVPGFGAEPDRTVTETAQRFLRNFRPNLTLVYLGNLDEVAHAEGAQSVAYQLAARQIDTHLAALRSELDLRHAVLVITADHGHIATGGHGGSDPDVLATPFVAIGGPILPGRYAPIQQVDIAPTICALLGAPIPRSSQGRIRFDLFTANIQKQAEAQVELALQRREQATLYLRSIGSNGLDETATGDVDVALSSLQVQNAQSAYRLATVAVDRIDEEVAAARQQRIERERRLRLPVALAAVALPLLWLVFRHRARDLWLLLGAGLTIGVFHGLYILQRYPYSFSVIHDTETLIRSNATRMFLASLAGSLLVLVWLVHTQEGSALAVIQTSLSYSLLTLYLLGCQAAFIYWLQGFRLTWYIPDMTATYWHLLVLIQTLCAAAIAPLLPVLLLAVGLIWQWVHAISAQPRLASGG